jgi:hypothetical protein
MSSDLRPNIVMELSVCEARWCLDVSINHSVPIDRVAMQSRTRGILEPLIYAIQRSFTQRLSYFQLTVYHQSSIYSFITHSTNLYKPKYQRPTYKSSPLYSIPIHHYVFHHAQHQYRSEHSACFHRHRPCTGHGYLQSSPQSPFPLRPLLLLPQQGGDALQSRSLRAFQPRCRGYCQANPTRIPSTSSSRYRKEAHLFSYDCV